MGLRWRKFLGPGVSGALVGFAAVQARRRSRRRRASMPRDVRGSDKSVSSLLLKSSLDPIAAENSFPR